MLIRADTAEAEKSIMKERLAAMPTLSFFQFSVREKDTNNILSSGDLAQHDINNVEVVFEFVENSEKRQLVWKPKSKEALEALFLD